MFGQGLGVLGTVEPKKLDGDGDAHLTASARSQPTEGRVGWTLQLLAEREIVDSITAGAQGTEKDEANPWLKQRRCILPKANAESVCAPEYSTRQAMEDLLEIDHRQYADNEVLVY